MRRLASRLLTSVVRIYRTVLTRCRRRKRSARIERSARLILAPMESREHPGTLAGGVFLAAFGYAFDDPLQGLALAVGPLNFAGGARAVPPVPAAFTGPLSNPTPVTAWLPTEPREAVAAEVEATRPLASVISVSAAARATDLDVEDDGKTSPIRGGFDLASSMVRDADPPSGAADAGSGVGVRAERGGIDGFSGGGTSASAGADSAGVFLPAARPAVPESDVAVSAGRVAALAGESGTLASPAGGEIESGAKPAAKGGTGSGFHLMGPGGSNGSSEAEATNRLPLVLITAPDPAAAGLAPSTGVVRFAYVGPALGATEELTVYFEVHSDLIHKKYAEGNILAPWDYSTSGNLETDYWIEPITNRLFGRVRFTEGRTAFVGVSSKLLLQPPNRGSVGIEIVPARDESTWEELPVEEQTYSIDELRHAGVAIDGSDGSGLSSDWPRDSQGQALPAAVSIAGIDPHLSEAGLSTGSYAVTRIGDTAEALGFYYRVMAKSTATEMADFTVPDSYTFGEWMPSGFSAGQRSAPLRVDPINDFDLEGDETVWVEVRPGSGQVGDRVWYDRNGDGLQDEGEAGVPGHAVRLKNTVTEEERNLTTDADGLYLFTNVPAGTYTVGFRNVSDFRYTVTDAGGDDGLDSDAIDDPSSPDGFSWTAEFTVEGDGPGIDFMDAGLVAPAVVGDFTWIDFNRNSVYDDTEPPLGGVVVTLFSADGVPVAVQTTAADGSYLFTDLPAGFYSVAFDPPAGYAAPFETDLFWVAPGSINLDFDAGFYPVADDPGSAGGTVYHDENGNGVREPGESGLSGATVTLTTETGTPVGEPITTDASGAYVFADLEPGLFKVQIELPLVFRKREVPPEQFRVLAGAATGSLDCGAYQPASVAGTAFADAANLGVRDAGEGGVAGVEVVLERDAGWGVWLPAARTATDGDGEFAFAELDPGAYRVQVLAPAGAVLTTPNPTGTLTAASGSAFALEAGLAMAIAGRITTDTDGDGIQESGDPGLTGATATLEQFDAGTSTWVVVGTPVVTGADGLYQFLTPAPGDYRVVVAGPSGFQHSPAGQGSDPTRDSDIDPLTGTSPTLAVAATGFGHTDIDAGLFQLGSLGGTVWIDDDGDGTFNGTEAGAASVSVALLDAGGTTLATTATASDGSYQFADLTPGNYAVAFAEASGFVFTHAHRGTDSALDSDAAADGVAGLVAVVSGEATANVSAGYVVPATVGGTVWSDTVPDGIADGESGLPGVTVVLLGATGHPLGPTTVTASDGLYSFADLVPDMYGVRFDPAGGDRVSPWSADSGANPGSDADPVTGATLAIAAGPGQALTFDAGVFAPSGAGVAGRVVDDPDRNGLLPVAPGLDALAGAAGVAVALLDAATAEVLSSAVTGPDGGYVFPNLAAGTYVVRIVPPGLIGPMNVGGGLYEAGDSDFDPFTATTAPIVLTSAFAESVDAAIDSTQEPGAVGGWVWDESGTADGVQDSGEAGRAGAVVELLRGGEVLDRTATDEDGFYSFGYVVPGEGYAVRFAAPSGTAFAPQDAGDDGTDSDADPVSGTTAAFAVAAGATADRDAGFVELDPDAGTVGGIVWLDANGNGLQDDGPGVRAGVSVTLSTAAGAFVASTLTGTGGGYRFVNVPPDDYRIAFAAPSGFALSPQHQGTNPALDSDPDSTTGQTGTIAVGADEVVAHIDAGLKTSGNDGEGDSELHGAMRGGMNFSMGMMSGLSSPADITHPAAVVVIHDDDSILKISDTRLTPVPVLAAVAGGEWTAATVASFTDTDALRSHLDYTAEIDWGFGEPTVGTITEGFQVRGVPPYERPGSYGITVTLTALYREDPYDSTHTSPIVYWREVVTHLTAVIDAPEVEFLEDPELEAELPDAVPAGTLAVFRIDPAYDDYQPFRYEADVYFGDASEPVVMPVVEDELEGERVFKVVSPGYAYERAGSYSVRVVVRDVGSNLQPGGVPVGRTDGTAEIAPGGEDPLTATSIPDANDEHSTAAEYELGEVTLADLEDSAVVIDWGDGSPVEDAVLTETSENSGRYWIGGAHAYRGAGVYGATFTVFVGGLAVGSRGTTFVIEEEAVTGGGAGPLDLVPGEGGGTFRIAAFTSEEASDASTEYGAWITWGDPDPTAAGEAAGAAARVFGSGGQFWIGVDPHTFPGCGVYTAVVRLWETGSPWAVWEGRTALSVDLGQEHAEDSLDPTLGVLRVEPADDFTDLRGWIDHDVLTSDDEPGLALTSFQPAGVGSAPPQAAGHPMRVHYYTIGATGVAYELPGVYGRYFEADKAQHAVFAENDVVITDRPLRAATVEAAVAEQPTPLGSLSLYAGFATGSVTVAQFADADPQPWGAGEPTGTRADWYQATIDWGDGVRTAGTLVAGGIGTLVTSSGHTYADAGTYTVAVFVADTEPFAGVSHSTALVQFEVVVAPTPFDAYQRRNERDESLWLPAGAGGAVSPNTGAVRLAHALDFDISPGTSVGLNPHLVYDSDTVNPRPVIEAVLSTGTVAVERIEATLTWDGVAQPTVTFTPGEYAAGPNWVIAVRPQDSAIATGVYEWTLDIAVYEPENEEPVLTRTKTDRAQVVNRTDSPFGAGWNLDAVWSVVPDADGDGGLQLVYGTGESRYFRKNGSRFVRPPEEHGTLKPKAGGYEYRDPSGIVRRFDADGRQTQIVDRNGLATTFTWTTTGLLSEVVAVDGQEVAFAFDGTDATITESDGRSVVVQIEDGDALRITDPGGTFRAFEYADHRAARDTWGSRITQYTWGLPGHDTDDLGAGFELGSGFAAAYDLVPASARGLWGGTSAPPSFADAFTGSLDDPRENPTAHVVDPLGRVRTTIFADGYFETTVRDAAGHVDRFTDARGNTTDYDRDRRGHIVRIAYPDGGTATFTRNGFGQITARTDSTEHTTRFTYDGQGNLLRVADPEGNATQYTYFTGAQVGLVESVTDARGFTTHFEYDSHRRLQASTDPYGFVTDFLYDAAGNPASVFDPLERSSYTVYDGLNRLRSATDVYGGVESWDYDATGLVTLHTDPRGATTQFTTDSRGLTTQTTEALGTALARTSKTEYDAAGNAVVEWRPRTYDGQTAANSAGEPFWDKVVAEFDVRNRPERVTEGSAYLAEETPNLIGHDGAQARSRWLGYDPNGNLAWEASSPLYDAAEATPEYFVVRSDTSYDAMNRTTSVTAGRAGYFVFNAFVETQPGRTTVHQYDLNGNLWYSIAPDSTRTVYAYDALDRLVKTTEAAGTPEARVTRTGFDAAGNVAWTLDGTGTKTLHAYDKLNRLEKTTEAVGTAVQRSTLFAYDEVGRVVAVWEPRSYDAPSGTPVRVGTFTAYDDTLRTETTTRAAEFSTVGTGITPFDHTSPATVVQRNAAGDIVRVTDPLGRVTKTDFDVLGRPVVEYENWSFPGTSETYDRGVQWSYDAADNVRRELRFGFTSSGSLQTATDAFAYDVHERQTQVRLAEASSGFPAATPTAVSSTQYDAWDQPVLAVDPAQHATQSAYTRFGELETLREGGLWDAKTTTASEFLRTTVFAYDDAGRVQSEMRDLLSPDQSEATYGGPRTVTTAYRYDRLGRTTAVVEAAGLSAVQRTTRSVYDANDRLIAVAVPLKTDAEIQAGAAVLGAAGVELDDFVRIDENEYDALGRLVRVTAGANSGFARTSTLGYDAADNLVWEAAARRYGLVPTSAAPSTAPTIAPEYAAVTVHSYDALNRRTHTVAAANAAGTLGHAPPETATTYDIAGRIIRVDGPLLPSGSRTSVTTDYDLLDQARVITEGTLVGSTFVGLRKETRDYDAAGNVTRSVSGQVVAGAKVDGAALESHPAATQFWYDARSRLVARIDEGAATTQGVRVTELRYDAADNLRFTIVRPQEFVPHPDPNATAKQLDRWQLDQMRITKSDYDRLDRRTAVTEGYAPDRFSNYEVATYTTDSLSQYNADNFHHMPPTTHTLYGAADQVLDVTDPRGVVSRFQYDPLGRLARSLPAAVIPQPSKQYNAEHFLQPETVYVYDAADRLVETKETLRTALAPNAPATFIVTRHRYDVHGRETATVEAVGTAVERRTETEYDPQDHPIRVVAGLAGDTTYRPYGLDYESRQFTQFAYDALGRTREVRRSTNGTSFSNGTAEPLTEFEYDAIGRTTDTITNTTAPGATGTVRRDTVRYDELGRQVEVREGARTNSVRLSRAVYDSSDNLTARTDTAGVTTHSTYNALQQLVSTHVDGIPTYTHYAPDIWGQTTSVVRTTSQYRHAGETVLSAQTLAYNRLGRLTLMREDPPAVQPGVTDTAAGTHDHETIYAYDAAGNQIAVFESVRPLVNTTPSNTTENPTAERLAQWRMSITRSEYDPLGRKVADIDAAGRRTATQYDTLGRVVHIADRNYKVANNSAYPAGGRFTSYDSRFRNFGYDALGRLEVEEWWTKTGEVPQLQEKLHFAADALGHPITSFRTDAQGTLYAQRTRTYDSLGNMTRESQAFDQTAVGAVNLNYQYDAAGRRVSLVDSIGGQTRTEYDPAGRIQRESLWITPSLNTTYAETFVFNAAAPSQSSAVLYDRVESVNGLLGTPAQVNGGTAPVALNTVNTYTSAGQLLARKHKDPRAAGAPILEETLTEYDALGRVSASHRAHRAVAVAGFIRADAFTYDGRNQVTSTTTSDGATAKTTPTLVDGAGNSAYAGVSEATDDAQENRAPQSVRWVWDATAQKEVRITVLNEYDGEGNLVFQIEYTQAEGRYVRAWQYDYDHRNRLVKVAEGSWDRLASTNTVVPRETVEYASDAEDRVYSRLSIWQPGAKRIDEYSLPIPAGDTNSEQQLFVRDGTTLYADVDGYTHQPTSWYVRGGPEHNLLGRVDLSGTRYFYATDKQGTVLSAYRDNVSALSVVKVVAYDRSSVQKRVRPEGEAAWHDRIEYAGLEYDPTTKMVSDTSRWFDPITGRYTGQTGPGLGSNPYSVAGNSAPNVEPEPKPSAPSPKDDRSLAEQFFDWNVRVGSSLVKPSANAGSGDFLDRQVFGRLGNLYNDDKTFQQAFDTASVGLHFVGGASDALSFGLTSLVANAGGYDASKRTAAESTAWTVGEVVGTVASLFIGFGAPAAAARLAKLGQSAKSAKALMQLQMIQSAVTVGEGVHDAATNGKGLTWENGLMIGGGLLGARMDLGGLAKLGAAGKVGRGLLAAEKFALTSNKAGRAVATSGRAVGDGLAWSAKQVGNAAHAVAQPFVKFGVHQVVGRTASSSTYARSIAWAERNGWKACFTGRMPIPLADGAQLIADVKDFETFGSVCDRVWARNEFDPDGPLMLRRVLRKFERTAHVLNLHIGGQLIETTDEHPYWVKGEGWTPAFALRIGDELRLMGLGWLPVDGIADSGRVETVYNLEIEGDHTYFVGCHEWKFSVWAHNANCGDVRVNAKTGQLQELRPSNGGKGPLRWQNAEPQPAASVTSQKTLYHYTNEAGEQGINASKQLHPSTLANNPRDVRYGNGQYLTDIAPGTMTPAELSRAFIGQPFQGRRFTNYVEVDVTGLNLIKGRDGVFVVPNNKSLDLNGRIVRSGAN